MVPKQRFTWLLIVAVMALAIVAFSLAMAQETKEVKPAPAPVAKMVGKGTPKEMTRLTKKDLPAPVLSAFEKTYPKAVIEGVRKEIKDSATFWDVQSMEGTVRRDLLYSPDGKVVREQEVIAPTALPQEATGTITKDYPNAKIEKVEKIVRGNTVEYKVWVMEPGKEKVELLLDGAGKLIKAGKSGK